MMYSQCQRSSGDDDCGGNKEKEEAEMTGASEGSYCKSCRSAVTKASGIPPGLQRHCCIHVLLRDC